MKKRIVAIIPVKGREPLLYHTVKRLTNTGVSVICVGHTEFERVVVEAAEGEFYKKAPDELKLGGKWQFALDRARELKPDAVLYMGSSDWVSENWCDTLYKDLENGYAMSGTQGIFFLDIQPENVKSMIWWGGYVGKRHKEPIGTGRLFSSKALDMMDWKLFDVEADNSIDYCQMQSLDKIKRSWGPKLFINNKSTQIAAVSISTYRWVNKHSFKKESDYQTATAIGSTKMDAIILQHFKEAYNLFEE